MHGEYKVPGGKLVTVDLEVVDGLLGDVRVAGDFFIEPDEALDDIDNALRGLPASSDAATFAAAELSSAGARGNLGLTPNQLQLLLVVAGFCCCVAMSMPQVHIVAYCSDLGYGVARGAEMLTVMMALGIVSRISSGFIADKIGGTATLALSSLMQGMALFLYLWFDGLSSLFIVTAIFGLFKGGIVPMYAVVIRDYMPPREAGMRIGVVMSATVFGMAFGGWVSGVIFDATSSYRLAFLNGLVWNLMNLSIVCWLMLKARPKLAAA